MIRKFVTATMTVALAALFYCTDRLEQHQAAMSASSELPRIAAPTEVNSAHVREPSSVKN